jgi:osmotically-inducible protein OsmY
MPPKIATGQELPEGDSLHPRHESWVRITTHNSFVGLMSSLALFVLFVVVIDLHLSRSALAVLGVIAVLIVLGLVWRSTPLRHRGFLGNAGLTARIKADLMTDLGTSNINVDSSNGVVTLRGTVPYADFREAAEHLARQRGAHQVINELKVVPSAAKPFEAVLKGFHGVTTSEGADVVATQPSLVESVREAFEADPRVNANVVMVSVEDGIAYLTGRQETVQGSDAATEVAAHVPGILGVSNDIEIMPSV